MTLTTLGDVRNLIERHLPEQCRQKATWRYVADQLRDAAHGANPQDLSVALRLALSLEAVECRAQ